MGDILMLLHKICVGNSGAKTTKKSYKIEGITRKY